MFTDVSTGFLAQRSDEGGRHLPYSRTRLTILRAAPPRKALPTAPACATRKPYEKIASSGSPPHADRSFLLPVSGPFRQRLSRSGDHTGSSCKPPGTTTARVAHALRIRRRRRAAQ